MFIDKVTIADKQLLVIQSDKGTKTFEWLSGEWEPREPIDIGSITISEETSVTGILISD